MIDSVLEIDNPALEDAVYEMIIGEIAKIRTMTPAKVVTYDATTQRAQVQPILRGRYVDEDSLEIKTVQPPILANVPVWWPGSAKGALYAPLEVGDDVMLLVSDRALAEWKQSDNDDLTPQDMRRFDLQDAVALPGTKHVNAALTGKTFFGENSALGARFVLEPGKVALGANGIEVIDQTLDVLNEYLNTITSLFAVTSAIAVAAASSPTTPVTNGTLQGFWVAGFNVATLTTQIANVTATIAALQSVKGSL